MVRILSELGIPLRFVRFLDFIRDQGQVLDKGLDAIQLGDCIFSRLYRALWMFAYQLQIKSILIIWKTILNLNLI